MVLLALVAGSPSALSVLPAKPEAGQEPTAAPILYNLEPTEGAVVSREELSRASATVETRRRASVSWAGIYIEGQLRPSTLMGPPRYQQTISPDLGDLSPGIHTARVNAVDSEGLAGGYVWKFTVA